MSSDPHSKVTSDHLQRNAYLYIRQSTVRQVFENTESTKRQYALRERAVALGWPIERVVVIDSDLGQSGASAADREGFQRLVTEVGLGRAGIVLGLEVSRLARNCTDWHRLLEICALTDTLILDEDGLYDPSHFNDRLLLGLKGTMSEAELHVLRARLRGGILNKARRGELKTLLPVGLVYDAQDRVVLDPDRQVQQAIVCFFQTYERTGSAIATVKFFRRQGLLFPRRIHRGLRKEEVVWVPLTHSRALQMLHNPRYAGAFFHGRTKSCKGPDARVRNRVLPQDQWRTLLLDAHPGYITWEQYQNNQRRLLECAQTQGMDRRKSPPGEGPALLQGLVLCGLCGKRMTIRYHFRKGRLSPDYVCQRDGIEQGEGFCQVVPGGGVDAAVGELLLSLMTPMTLEVALAVQEELQNRLDEADRLRKQHVERARYEVELARRRFMLVDPNNRLVADALEADWNDKLRILTETQEQYERHRQEDRAGLDEASKARILTLARDFPQLWRDPKTADRERKRMVRLLVEDVALTKEKQITVQVRLKGGATRTLILPIPLPAWAERQTSAEVVSEIDRLLNDYTEKQIAEQLNQRGLHSGMGCLFTSNIIARIRRTYRLKSRHQRLRELGFLTAVETARLLKISPCSVKIWRTHGLLRGHLYNDRNQYLYELSDQDNPVKSQGRKLSERRRFPEVSSNQTNEVQHGV